MNEQTIADIVLRFYPVTEAIYLFGSYGTEYERPDSDVDIALLLPHRTAKEIQSLALTPVWSALQAELHREVDLINLRLVNTVFQNEIINTARVISCADENERLAFEMTTLSAYQKLNEERKEILDSFFQTKRAYKV